MDVLRVNLHRLHALWPAFHAHASALLADARAPVRAAAVDAFGRALGAALATSGRSKTLSILQSPNSQPSGKRIYVGAPVLADARAAGAAAEENGNAAAAEGAADAPAAEQGAALAGAGGGAAEAAAGGAGGAGGEGLKPELQSLEPAAAVGGLDAGAEEMLLEALRGLYAGAREPDVRLGLLRVLLQVLQRHGAPHAHLLSVAQGCCPGTCM